jgi:hypothetical protein
LTTGIPPSRHSTHLNTELKHRINHNPSDLELLTFDVMLDEFGLGSDALDRLAVIVRGADTAALDQAPQAAGLLAASLMYRDDLTQLDAAMTLYDAFYRWARDALPRQL